MEHQIEHLEEEPEENTNYNELANGVIRRFCSREVGWLEEDIDDATYEKHIIMTEQGVLLSEFLQQLMKPEREEFSSYIFNVYNILKDPDQWEDDPYINGLRAVYRNAKLLSKALKRLATFIKKIIERMVQELSLIHIFNGWQLVSGLKKETGLPAATSFKHVSPAGAAVGLPLTETLAKIYWVEDMDWKNFSPLACAYALSLIHIYSHRHSG